MQVQATRAFGSKGETSRFDLIRQGLSKHLIVYVDEIGQDNVSITAGTLNGWTGFDLIVEYKGVDETERPRSATVAMFGDKPAKVDIDAQGVQERIPYVAEHLEDKIDDSLAAMIVSDEAIDFWRWALLQRYHDLRTTRVSDFQDLSLIHI